MITTDELRLVFWELTARCNLKCQHCRAEAQADFVAGELTTAELIQVARDIRDAGDPILILTGGEPLVRPDFFEIAAACTKLFTRVALATNGTLIEDDLARRIVATGIQRVSISLDGAQPATHDRFRGLPGSFAAALRGFDTLKRAGASLQVNVTVTRHNEGELAELLDLILARGADAFHVFMLVPVGCGAVIGDDVRLPPERAEAVLRWLFERSTELRGRVHVKATCAPQYYRILHDVSRERHLAKPAAPHRGMEAMTRGCLAGSAVCFISRTGDVQPCGYLPLCAGNVRNQKLGDLWRHSELFAALRDPARLHGKCGACGYRRLCQGCRARAYAESGDFLGAEPDCPYVPGQAEPLR
jgi:radical SAM protein with 4Fe4S-binding SPASM domain